jgi:hypothetical protein
MNNMSWDCIALGLVVNPGDRIETGARGVAVDAPPLGPHLQLCFCNDDSQPNLCAQVDCDSAIDQVAICEPRCAAHGGLAAIGCLPEDNSCTVQ